MTRHSLILDFIRQFTNNRPEVTQCFTNGMCYWFAHILHTRFWGNMPNVYIAYDPVANHFGCSIDDKVYDVTGEVTNSYQWRMWNSYTYTEHLEAKRIYRDCILKVPADAPLCGLCEQTYEDDYGNLICSRDNHPCYGDDICKFLKERK